MKLTLPLPPNLANARLHWRAKVRKKDAYYMRCLVAAPKRPRLPYRRARIMVTLYTHQKMDADNLMARLKWPLDFLVKRGFIVDDSPDVLEWGVPRQAIDRKNQRVKIELDPVADEPPRAA